MDLAEPLVLLPGLVILGMGRAARFDDAGIYLWMARLRHEKEMILSEAQQDTMLGRILGEANGVPAPVGLDDLDLVALAQGAVHDHGVARRDRGGKCVDNQQDAQDSDDIATAPPVRFGASLLPGNNVGP